MADHLHDLGKTLYEQRGSLTTEVCKKAVEDAIAKIEREQALTGVHGQIERLRTYLMKNQSDPERCLAEIRRMLLVCEQILVKSKDAPKIPPKANGDAAKGKEANSGSSAVSQGKPT